MNTFHTALFPAITTQFPDEVALIDRALQRAAQSVQWSIGRPNVAEYHLLDVLDLISAVRTLFDDAVARPADLARVVQAPSRLTVQIKQIAGLPL